MEHHVIKCTLLGDTDAMYHKLKTIVKLEDKEDEGGSGILTLWFPGEIKAGDIISYYHTEPYVKVEAVLENRDHRGKFSDPLLAKNSFWMVKVSFIRRHLITETNEKPTIDTGKSSSAAR